MGVLHAIADVILILAALFALVAFGFLAYAGLIILRLVKEVKGEVSMLTQTTRESLQEVQGTTRFISESIVKPASLVVGYAAAIRATVKALTEDVVSRSRS